MLALSANLFAGRKAFFLSHYDSKFFSLSKLNVILPFKSYMEATTSGKVDQLWTKVECCSHTREREISQPEVLAELWLPCLLSWHGGVADEI